MRKVFLHGHACISIFLIFETTVWRGLYGDLYGGVVRHDPLALQGSEGHAVVYRNFFLSDQSYLYRCGHINGDVLQRYCNFVLWQNRSG